MRLICSVLFSTAFQFTKTAQVFCLNFPYPHLLENDCCNLARKALGGTCTTLDTMWEPNLKTQSVIKIAATEQAY
jgi:hypothetical protein